MNIIVVDGCAAAAAAASPVFAAVCCFLFFYNSKPDLLNENITISSKCKSCVSRMSKINMIQLPSLVQHNLIHKTDAPIATPPIPHTKGLCSRGLHHFCSCYVWWQHAV
jgi:hypothetical protein